MSNQLKHVKHLRTSAIEYVNINVSSIPLTTSITSLDTIPTTSEIIHMVNPPQYIYIPSEDKYYQLKGKQPNVDILEFGEIAISFSEGYESIMFKNKNNKIVELTPNTNKDYTNVGGTYTIYNPAMPYNDTYEYTWKIPYTELMSNQILIDTCTVSLKEVATGKQVIGDITFNSADETIDIVLTSTNPNGLLENEYVALCTVLHEKVSTYISSEMITKEYDNLNTININNHKREYIINHINSDIEFTYTSDSSFTHLEHYMLLHNTSDEPVDVSFGYLCNGQISSIIGDVDTITVLAGAYCEISVLPISTGLVMTYSNMLTTNN